jgi:hypothetical protein
LKGKYQILQRKIRILRTFYRSFSVASIALSFVGWWIIWKSGSGAVAPIFWLKIGTSALIFYFIQADMKEQFYYYQNLGFSRKQLWISTMGFDFGLFLIGCYLILTFL